MRITNFLEIGKLSASARDALNMKSWVAVSLKPFVFSGTIPTHNVNGTVWEQLHANFIYRASEITSEFHVVDSLAQGLGRAYQGRTFTVAHGTSACSLLLFFYTYIHRLRYVSSVIKMCDDDGDDDGGSISNSDRMPFLPPPMTDTDTSASWTQARWVQVRRLNHWTMAAHWIH